jgi:hypothetical protein
MNPVFGPQAKQRFEFLDGVPELGARVVVVHEQVLRAKVLGADDIRPKALPIRNKFPDPFDHETLVH